LSRFLGIDPGRHTGWAVVEDGELVVSGKFSVASKYDTKSVQKIYNFLVSAREEYGISTVFVETQYVGSFMATALRLAEVRGWWEACAAIAELEFVAISSSHWRRAVFGKLPKMKSAELKKLSVTTVKDRFHLKEVSEDEAEAILIALGGAKELPTLREMRKARKRAKAKKKEKKHD
jgi:Holliday junction resolvasome RuvABC endonuclease subunit